MLISLITIFLSGLIFMILAVPLILRKVKINDWYGVRIPQTMKNEKVWYEVNAYVGKYIFALGFIISALTLLFYFNPPADEVYTIFILLGILIIGSISLIIISINYSKKFDN